MGVPPLSN